VATETAQQILTRHEAALRDLRTHPSGIGPQGLPGPQGDPGPTGPQGDPGPAGAPGATFDPSVTEALTITAYGTGWAQFDDPGYQNLMVWIGRDGICHITGLMKAAAGVTVTVTTLTGNYVPKNARAHILGGAVQDVTRLFNITATGVVQLRGAVPTAGINGFWPGQLAAVSGTD
jgi:hypothetical protein